jgi:hypothetical protein
MKALILALQLQRQMLDILHASFDFGTAIAALNC